LPGWEPRRIEEYREILRGLQTEILEDIHGHQNQRALDHKQLVILPSTEK
jgi:hypothetical protein